MIRVISVRNVNEAFSEALGWLRVAGVKEDTRNGPCLVAPGPVITEYRNPTERILWNERRDANHVFHLLETIWMFAGRRNVHWLLPFNPKYANYAEPNGEQHGAYGGRWRIHFGLDQIKQAIQLLKANPQDRRVVIGMWDPFFDLGAQVRDVPCNTHIYFDGRGERVNMTVCCRSNDMLWGAYGANVVHFSMLQEVVAWGAGMPVGVYRQFSNNFHVYTDLPQVREFLDCLPPEVQDGYVWGYEPTPIFKHSDESVDVFLQECGLFVDKPEYEPTNEFLRTVARPLERAYRERKEKKPGWTTHLEMMPNYCDWKQAFVEWTQRRNKEQA